MKIKEFLECVFDKITLIDEYCDGRFVGNHSLFCISKDGNFLELYFTGDQDRETKININQDLQIVDNRITCEDTDGNKLDLYFWKYTPAF